MAKIARKTAQLFAVGASSTQIEQFGSLEQLGSLVYSIDPAVIQALPAWATGWSAAQYLQTFAPYYQDRNAVDLVHLYQLAYALEMGIAEWDINTTYFTTSVVQSGNAFFASLQDNNLGNVPPVTGSNALWSRIAFPTTFPVHTPTRTVLLSGSGTYTPPLGCLRAFVRMVGGGGGGGSTSSGSSANNGGNTTLGTYTAGGGRFGQNISGGGSVGGIGGTASGGDINVVGAVGGSGQAQSNGGSGGVSVFGGASPSISAFNTTPSPASANSGSGGGGSGSPFIAGVTLAGFFGGGGAGGYLEKTIFNPTSMAYSIGAGGPGVSGVHANGGNGGSGIIIIDEFYY